MVLLKLCFILASAFAEDTIRLVIPGTQHKESVPYVEHGDSWYHVDERGASVEKIRMFTTPADEAFPDYVPDGGTVEIETRYGQSGFLIKGLKIKEGELKPWSSMKKVEPGSSEKIDFKYKKYTKKISLDAKKDSKTESYILTYSVDGMSKVLINEKEYYPYLTSWVGDINDDGIPEVMAEVQVHSNGAKMHILFLSNTNGKTLNFQKIKYTGLGGC